MKNTFLFLSIAFCGNIASLEDDSKTLRISSEFTTTQEAHNHFTTKKAEFAWDLHNVLVSRTKWTFLQGGLGSFGVGKSFTEKMHLYGQLAHAFINYNLLSTIKKLIQSPLGKNKITESYFNIVGNFGYIDLKKELISFANNIFLETPEMALLVDDLDTHNHTLFSNIGPLTLDDIHSRKLFPQIFDGKRFLKNSINHTVPALDGIYTVWKSKPDAYSEFEIFTGATENKKSIIFVDDKLKNITAAPEEWNCILFTSVEQLKTDLALLGIKLK
jgi:hypothetical protein